MPKNFVVLGLTLGDEGKGTTVEYLVRKHNSKWVVRFNGGPQAVHNVVEKNRWHDFSQFSSGTFIPGTNTFLTQGMLINIIDIIDEDYELAEKGVPDAAQRMFLHEDCRVITPIHQMLNRLRETRRGKKRHSSTGRGIGETVRDYTTNDPLRLKDAFDKKLLREKLSKILQRKEQEVKELVGENPSEDIKKIHTDYNLYCTVDFLSEVYHRFAMAYKKKIGVSIPKSETIIFEGAQGALLDVDYGFFPFITKTNTTVHEVPEIKNPTKVGILRAYGHRHGNGPFPTHARDVEKNHKELHNIPNEWQGVLRVGWFDIVFAKYGIALNDGVDWISLTNLDQLSGVGKIKVCTHYTYCESLPKGFVGKNKGKESIITGIKKIHHGNTQERADILEACTPMYVELNGWDEDITGVKTFKDLPKAAQAYIEFLEEQLQTPIKLISVNPRFDGKFER